MGDMADYYADLMYDEPNWDDYEDGDGPAQMRKTCRCCGETGLVWGTTGGKWRLFTEKGKLHACKKVPLKQ